MDMPRTIRRAALKTLKAEIPAIVAKLGERAREGDMSATRLLMSLSREDSDSSATRKTARQLSELDEIEAEMSAAVDAVMPMQARRLPPAMREDTPGFGRPQTRATKGITRPRKKA